MSFPSRKILTAALPVLSCLLMLISINGCGESFKATDGGVFDESEQRCNDLLASSLEMLRPENLGVSSNREAAVGPLNQWLDGCAEEQGDVDARTDSPVYTGLLENRPDELERLQQLHFTGRDAAHVRDCLLFKEQAEFVTLGVDDELERVVRLFDYVVTSIALADDPRVPLNVFEVQLLGRGTALDRTWCFAGLLKQLRIDAVVLRPQAPMDAAPDASAESTDGSAFLVGVLIDEDVLLFDPRLGRAVPALDSNVEPNVDEKPATLSQVLADGSLLKRLGDEARPYPIQADQLKSPRVEVVSDSGFWSQPMHRLQGVLAGDRAAIVYDALVDTAAGDGLITRVVDAGGDRWNRDDVSLWLHPTDRIHAAAERDEAERQRLLVLTSPFDAPVVEKVADGVYAPIPPTRELLKTRIEQLLGRFASAIRGYLPIRVERNIPDDSHVPPEARRIQAVAGEHAAYWTALAQMQQKKYAAAVDSFRLYESAYPAIDARWNGWATARQAVCLARRNRFKEAVEAVDRMDERHPEYPAMQLARRDWSRSIATETGADGEKQRPDVETKDSEPKAASRDEPDSEVKREDR